MYLVYEEAFLNGFDHGSLFFSRNTSWDDQIMKCSMGRIWENAEATKERAGKVGHTACPLRPRRTRIVKGKPIKHNGTWRGKCPGFGKPEHLAFTSKPC